MPNQTSARSSHTAPRPSHNNAAAATKVVPKTEDNSDDGDDVYRSRPQLQEPTVLMRDLADLMKMLQAGDIDVDPEYQRNVVWTADRMTGLIDSLMERFYIPPIILNKKPRPHQNARALQEVYVCVDGKQRLSSILAFIKGIIPCHDHRGEKWWFCEPEGSKRKRILSEKQQREFLRRDLMTSEYIDLSPEQEEDLFARVQMGVQLNLAEKMRASTGPWQELASLFVTDFPSVYSLIKDKARSKDFQLTLSCFSQIVECMHPTAANGVPALKTNHTHLPKLLSNKSAVDDALKSHLASVWNTFTDLINTDPDTFTNANKYLRGVQTFAPVEMVAVTILLSIYSETRNNRLLLGDIQAMRTAVRENFVDLRLNVSLWKWFWEYIDNLEAIRGAINGSTILRKTKQRTKKNDDVSNGTAAAGSTVASITAAAAAPKRGRFTARTKRLAETSARQTLDEEIPAAVKQEPVTAPMPGPPPSKRRRTETDLPNEFADTGNESLEEMLTGSVSSLPPITTHASTQSPLFGSRRPHQRAEPALSVPQGTASVSRQASENIGPVQLQGKSPTPAEARRQRVGQLNNYQYALGSSTEPRPNDLPAVPMLQGADLVLSDHEIWHVQDTQQPEMHKKQAASRVPLPGQPRPTHRPSTSRSRSIDGQHDDTIDLTTDTEQERASLLSAFKTRPVATGASKNTSKPAPEPALQRRKPTEPRKSSQDLPTRENNPYARYRAF